MGYLMALFLALCFSLSIFYVSPLGKIIGSYGIHFHLYADDAQLYVLVRAEDPSQITKLKSWMSSNFLLLNPDKTEMLAIGATRQRQLDQVTLTLVKYVCSKFDCQQSQCYI